MYAFPTAIVFLLSKSLFQSPNTLFDGIYLLSVESMTVTTDQ